MEVMQDLSIITVWLGHPAHTSSRSPPSARGRSRHQVTYVRLHTWKALRHATNTKGSHYSLHMRHASPSHPVIYLLTPASQQTGSTPAYYHSGVFLATSILQKGSSSHLLNTGHSLLSRHVPVSVRGRFKTFSNPVLPQRQQD